MGCEHVNLLLSNRDLFDVSQNEIAKLSSSTDYMDKRIFFLCVRMLFGLGANRAMSNFK